MEDGKSYNESDSIETKKSKKRRHDRVRYSPEPIISQNGLGKHHNRKRKHQILDPASETEPPRQGIKLFVSTYIRE